MIRFVLLFFLFASVVSANVENIPTPKFEAFTPTGIRVSLPNMKGVSGFFFWANINEALEGPDLGDIQLRTYEPTDGEWVLEDMNIKLNPGDILYYTFFVIIDGVVHRYERQEYKVEEIIVRPSTTTTTTTTTPPTSTTTTTAKPTTTTPEPTTAIPEKECEEKVVHIDFGTEGKIIIRTEKDGKVEKVIDNGRTIWINYEKTKIED